jgi:hypothetical protein
MEVEVRHVVDTAEGSVLRYRCRGEDFRSELWVTAVPSAMVVWCRDECEERLAADEIEVWSEG